MTKNGQLQNGLSDFSATRKVTFVRLKTNPSNKRLRCQGSDLQATPKLASNEQLGNKITRARACQALAGATGKLVGDLVTNLSVSLQCACLGIMGLLASCPCPWLKECFPAEPRLLFARLYRTVSNQECRLYATFPAKQLAHLHFNFTQMWHFLTHSVKHHAWVY